MSWGRGGGICLKLGYLEAAVTGGVSVGVLGGLVMLGTTNVSKGYLFDYIKSRQSTYCGQDPFCSDPHPPFSAPRRASTQLRD